jgi:hypothetical protein
VGASDRCSPDANSASHRASFTFNLDIHTPAMTKGELDSIHE